MRLYEILRPLTADEQAEIDRLCSPNTPPDLRAAIEDDWRRAPPPCLSPEEMQMMYGHNVEKEELQLRKLRAEVAKIEAEATKIETEAARAHAEAGKASAEAAAAHRSSRRS